MTERDRGLPWWDFDPEERPVPLIGVADEAEGIVRSAQEAIAREDTDPAVVLPGSRPRLTGNIGVLRRPVGAMAAVLLLGGCAGMFVLGWREGSAAARVTRPPTSTHSTTLRDRPHGAPVMKATFGRHRGGSNTEAGPSIPRTKEARKK